MSKRNNEAARVERHKKTTKGESRYAKKVAAGNQMYGPGCCAHRITDAQMAARRNEARIRGHFDNKPMRIDRYVTLADLGMIA
jgi:hypothetical protein